MTESGLSKGKRTLYLRCDDKKILLSVAFLHLCNSYEYIDTLQYFKIPWGIEGKSMLKNSMDSIVLINEEKYCISDWDGITYRIIDGKKVPGK